jgi:hypothetical protein
MSDPFRYFNSSPEVIRPVVMMYVKYPLSLRNVEDLLAERGIDISHETVRSWWNRFGPMFAAEIRKKRVAHMRGYPEWRWRLDEGFVRSTASSAISGASSIMKARFWKRSSLRAGQGCGAEVSQARDEDICQEVGPSRRSPSLQTKASRLVGRVARPRGLMTAWVWPCCAMRRRPVVTLTEPPRGRSVAAELAGKGARRCPTVVVLQASVCRGG